jgi:hypothetical protein
MAAQDMTDAFKHPHPDVPFSTMGDDAISALATLAPVKAATNKQPEALVQPTLTSSLKHQYQTRFQKQVIPTDPANPI